MIQSLCIVLATVAGCGSVIAVAWSACRYIDARRAIVGKIIVVAPRHAFTQTQWDVMKGSGIGIEYNPSAPAPTVTVM